MGKRAEVSLYFSDVFGVNERELEEYGAFNISLAVDLPLFIDPFLLFASEKEIYQQLHEQMIDYLRFLREKSETGLNDPDLIKALYTFSEVKQNWLGFCDTGNTGQGLGLDFANTLNSNLVKIFGDFGREKITSHSHLEKLCLIKAGVGRDKISDFTTNLIKNFLLQYTQDFAIKYIKSDLRREYSINKVRFDYNTERWLPAKYELPVYLDDYIILTPIDILTKDDTWINHSDMVRRFEEIPDAIVNQELRASINNYFRSVLPKEKKDKKGRKLKIPQKEIDKAINETFSKFPELIDFYIKIKEDSGDEALENNDLQVTESDQLYVKQFGEVISLLNTFTNFYSIPGNTYEESLQKVSYFKEVIENKGGYKCLYFNGRPIKKERDVHLMFKLVWCNTISDVSSEVNDGRGSADFKISRGKRDKTIIEFKLASNSKLKKNLEKQAEIYMKASNADHAIKVIVYFTESELALVESVLQELNLLDDENVILVDARDDNKPSASYA
jgi:hypothetical protein